MKLTLRTLAHRLFTYPVLLPIMVVHGVVSNKVPVLDAFYLVRGVPHGYFRNGLRTASYDGVRMLFPFREDPNIDDVWLRNVYFPYVPKREDVVLDVGAQMGFFTLKVARKVKQVIAVEPDPTNLRFLVRNIRANHLESKVRVIHAALGSSAGEASLDRGGYGYGRTRVSTSPTPWSVRMYTVDDLLPSLGADCSSPSLIKIDTEGYELEVLKGSKRVLSEGLPSLLLASYHYPGEHLELAKYLRPFGYRILEYRVSYFLRPGAEIYLYAEAKTHR